MFVVDTKGQLNVFSVQGTGKWSDAVPIGPAGVAPTSAQLSSGAFVAASQQFGVTNRLGGANQTDVFVLNENGTNGPGWPMVYWSSVSFHPPAPTPVRPPPLAIEWFGPKALVAEV